MLSANQVLALYERSAESDPCTQAIALVAALSGHDEDAVAGLSINARDRQLIALQRAMFGHSVVCVTECPACGAQLDVDFVLDDLPLLPESDKTIETVHESWQVSLRPPTSRDLLLVRDTNENVERARRMLFERLVTHAACNGEPASPDHIPAEVEEQAVLALANAQSASDIELALSCPDCGHQWAAPYDVASHLATGIRDQAEALMFSVHQLASRYGWTEEQILALPAQRRAFYLAQL